MNLSKEVEREEREERREGREKSIVHLSVEVTSAPSDREVANLSCERI